MTSKLFNTIWLWASLTSSVFCQQLVRGVVYLDLNKNGSREVSEPGLPNVSVSNGITRLGIMTITGMYLPIKIGMERSKGFSAPVLTLSSMGKPVLS